MGEKEELKELLRNEIFVNKQKEITDSSLRISEAQILNATGVSRQVFRMAIEKGIIEKKKDGEKTFFTSDDLITMYVINSLMEFGIEFSKSRGNTEDTIVNYFNEADNDLVKVLDRSSKKINEQMKNLYEKITILSLISNGFTFPGGKAAIDSCIEGMKVSIPDEIVSLEDNYLFNSLVGKLDKLAEAINEDDNEDVDYKYQLSQCITSPSEVNVAKEQVYDDLQHLQFMLNDATNREKLSDKVDSQTIENASEILKRCMELLIKKDSAVQEAVDGYYYSMIDQLLSITPKKLTKTGTNRLSKQFIESLGRREVEDEESKELLKIYLLIIAFSSANGKFAMRLNQRGGQGAANKIITAAQDTFLDELFPLLDQFDGTESTLQIIDKIIEFYSSYMPTGLMSTDEMTSLIDILLNQIKVLLSDDEVPDNYWEYAKQKITDTITKKFKEN